MSMGPKWSRDQSTHLPPTTNTNGPTRPTSRVFVWPYDVDSTNEPPGPRAWPLPNCPPTRMPTGGSALTDGETATPHTRHVEGIASQTRTSGTLVRATVIRPRLAAAIQGDTASPYASFV
ncbi:hypothetical protein RhiLY_02998 [Ceratobasidium sp. AG-Ba]|nr:hypothetical protein RhiLY_02998 [Ceratobasidium sp. AG-Ba]